MINKIGGQKFVKAELWQQDDDTIEIFLDRAIRQLTMSGIIPMTDDVQDSPRYESIIQNLAEDLFDNDDPLYERRL